MGTVDRLGLVGQTIDGRYQVTGLIGEGGMGVVYRAQHTRIGRIVAIKCLHRRYAEDQQALHGFFNEARITATLQHPNIAESTDMGELPNGAPYLVLELLDGRSLHDELDYTGRLSVRRSLRIARQIAAGVQAAHEAGVIHRDLKSDNVFLIDRDSNPDHVKIFDFGVAHVLERIDGEVKPDQIVGTPEFMAPEQMTDPDNVDGRVDVYALGAILYHMLAGKKPHGASGRPIHEQLTKILQERPPPVMGVPEDVRLLVEQAMEFDREQRIPSMTELIGRIDQITPPGRTNPSIPVPNKVTSSGRHALVTAAPTPAPTPAPRSRRVGIAVAAAAFVAGCVGAFFVLRSRPESKDPALPAASPPVASAPANAAAGSAPAPSTEPANAAPTAPPRQPPVAPIPAGSAAPARAAAVAAPAQPVRHVTAKPHPQPHPRKDQIASAPSTPLPPEPEAKAAEPPPEVPAPQPTAKADAAATPPKPQSTPKTQPPPKPQPAAATTSPDPKPGTIDINATRAAMRAHLPAVQRCFERAKMDDLSLNGSVTFRITVAADGGVASAQVASSTLGSPAAERCIQQEIASWHLPKPSGGVAASFAYPFVFD
jgi:serine/threonine-protein kinase